MRQNAKQNNASNSTLEPKHRSFCESLRYSTTTSQGRLREELGQISGPPHLPFPLLGRHHHDGGAAILGDGLRSTHPSLLDNLAEFCFRLGVRRMVRGRSTCEFPSRYQCCLRVGETSSRFRCHCLACRGGRRPSVHQRRYYRGTPPRNRKTTGGRATRPARYLVERTKPAFGTMRELCRASRRSLPR